MKLELTQQTIVNFLTIQKELFNCLEFYLDENSKTAKVTINPEKENELYEILLRLKKLEE